MAIQRQALQALIVVLIALVEGPASCPAAYTADRANANARRKVARKAYRKLKDSAFSLGSNPSFHQAFYFEQFRLWSVRWLRAEWDLNPDKAHRIFAAKAHLKRMNEVADAIKAAVDRGTTPSVVDPQAGKFFRLEAEKWLRRVRNERE
jgi:hypothetical protein